MLVCKDPIFESVSYSFHGSQTQKPHPFVVIPEPGVVPCGPRGLGESEAAPGGYPWPHLDGKIPGFFDARLVFVGEIQREMEMSADGRRLKITDIH